MRSHKIIALPPKSTALPPSSRRFLPDLQPWNPFPPCILFPPFTLSRTPPSSAPAPRYSGRISSAGVRTSASVLALGGGADDGTAGGGKAARTLAKETWVMEGRGSATMLFERSWLTCGGKEERKGGNETRQFEPTTSKTDKV